MEPSYLKTLYSIRMPGKPLMAFLSLFALAVASSPLISQEPVTLNEEAGEAVAKFEARFRDIPGIGSDPFFPKSLRRKPILPEDEEKPKSEEEIIEAAANNLKLTGLVAYGQRPIAMVNSVPILLGKERAVAVDGQKINVKVIKIEPHAVSVRVEGRNTPLVLKRPNLKKP